MDNILYLYDNEIRDCFVVNIFLKCYFWYLFLLNLFLLSFYKDKVFKYGCCKKFK